MQIVDNQGIDDKNVVKIPKRQEGKKRILALRPSQVVNKVRIVYEFDGIFKDCVGNPEKIAKWFITGAPYSGKSSFLFMLCEYLCKFGNVDYNSYEEKDAQTGHSAKREH